ncbi:hypothetical protein [Alkalibacillus haloalkaliphilus]|uniref:DUF4440 domain-containing protein n=1 Tax=Alkalibacillus haloalkaliphilus TaxID=94136 RepID=A0A511W8N0_9BACI|nr:hypothetical protein AHA02nite_24840 [Alkalibacillus haloalkaliphilus]
MNNLKSHLQQLEESHINLEVRKSNEQLDHILADDFLEISSSGKMYGK